MDALLMACPRHPLIPEMSQVVPMHRITVIAYGRHLQWTHARSTAFLSRNFHFSFCAQKPPLPSLNSFVLEKGDPCVHADIFIQVSYLNLSL